MDNFQGLIKEICEEKNIDFRLLSKDWIMKLSKDGRAKFIVGMRFPINSYSSATICVDKYALYQVLENAGIPVVEHCLMYREGYLENYSSDLIDREELEDYLNKHREVVVKDTCGSNGLQVYRANSYQEVREDLDKIFERKDTAVICPFLNIEAEYRVIVLEGAVEVIFSKERTGDKWRHNLSNGAVARIIEDEDERKRLSELALRVASAIDIRFASVDLVKVNGELMVLEVNSSVCMNKFIEQVPSGREIAKRIYSGAINLMF
ncbi:MAG: ATP-grasp domain-containing protein [Clostridia bacterium]|nr:ATP-grasp domain-containing protein [Clostridia bacterium]